jgi:hypothetical protein
MRRRWAALVLVLALTACSNKGDDVQTMPQEQAKTQTGTYAEATRLAAGVTSFAQSAANVTPCEGRAGELSDPDEVYYVQGIYQLLVPADQHPAVLANVRRQWESDGYTITGDLTARTPDEFELSLTAGQPPAMQLLVSSPCYRNP